MKVQKLSFDSIQKVLSRAEMKKIMAGSGVTCNDVACGTITQCNTGCTCEFYSLQGGTCVAK